MNLDFKDKVALVTGGTKGIGLATALAFAGRGARTVITYRFGTADEAEVLGRFAAIGAAEPLIVQADVSRPDETTALMAEIKRRHGRIDVFVSNAAGGVLVRDLDDLTERSLLKTMRYGAWPTLDYLFKIHAHFGAYPRYVVAISSTGPDRYSVNYDLVAASKAALEGLCRYLTHRLRDEAVNINVVRTLGVMTDAFHATFGSEASEFVLRHVQRRRLISEDEVAGVVLALCSGLLDGMRGQVVTVDHGAVFYDNTARLYREHEELGL